MTPSNPYSSIDSIVRAWSEANSLKLFNHFAGREERFCYISSPQGECFQISIQAPHDTSVTVDAWSVETLDNRELHQTWVVQIPELRKALDAALSRVHSWLRAN